MNIQKLKRNKYRTLILWIGIFLVAVIFFIYLFDLSRSEAIQSFLMATLISITSFYAMETKWLVDKQDKLIMEERKLKKIDYLENRMSNYVSPLLLALREYRFALDTADDSLIKRSFMKINYIFLKRMHWFSDMLFTLSKKLNDHQKTYPEIDKSDVDKINKWKDIAIGIVEEFYAVLVDEFHSTMEIIDSTYGIDSIIQEEKVNAEG